MNKNELVLAGFTLALLSLLLLAFQSVLAFLGASVALALVGNPLMKIFLKLKLGKFKLSKGTAAFLTLLSFYAIIVLIFVLIIPSIISEATKISQINPAQFMLAAQEPIAQIELFISKYTHADFSLTEYINQKVIGFINFTTISTGIGIITNLTGNILVYFFTISFITFFFLKDGPYFFEKVKAIFPSKYQKEIPKIIDDIKEKLSRYLLGIALQVFVLFLVLAIGFYFCDIESFILLAVIGALLNIIPYIGPIVALIIACLLSILTLCTGDAACLELIPSLLGKILLVFAIGQSLDNMVLQPLILSKSVNAHPLEIFLVVLICGNFYGISGMILAIPIYSACKIIFIEIRKKSEFLNSIYQKNGN